MTLGQQIAKQFGTSAYGKDAYAKQKELYQKMGSPLGNYIGSLQQNLHLLKNQSKWGSLMAPPPPPPAPTPMPTPQNAAEQIVKSQTKDVKPGANFEDVVNRDLVVNKDMINQLAQSEALVPAYIRDAEQYRNFKNQQANTGSWRTASRGGEQQLLNQQAMQRENDLDYYRQAMEKDLGTYYDNMKDMYTRDPNAFQLNNFNAGLQEKMKDYKPNTVVSDELIGGFNPYDPSRNPNKRMSMQSGPWSTQPVMGTYY